MRSKTPPPSADDSDKETLHEESPSGDDSEFRKAVKQLQDAGDAYIAASDSGKCDEEQMRRLELDVYEKMRKAGDSSSDPKVKSHYRKKAKQFKAANAQEKRKMTNDVLKGLMIILAAPFALAAAVIVVAGGILYGVGSLIKGIGNAFTFGLASSADSWNGRGDQNRNDDDDEDEDED